MILADLPKETPATVIRHVGILAKGESLGHVEADSRQTESQDDYLWCARSTNGLLSHQVLSTVCCLSDRNFHT